MGPLLSEIRRNPLLWMLAFVPIVLVAEKAAPDAHTALFVLAVLAIVPLAALLSHATEAPLRKRRATLSAACSTRLSAISPNSSLR
jgi:Ca2+:H+ antiporter